MAEVNQRRLSTESVNRLREILGDDAVDRLLNVAASRRENPAAPIAAPRDAGKFVRQLAAAYCDETGTGQMVRPRIASIIKAAMEVINIVAEANPEPKP